MSTTTTGTVEDAEHEARGFADVPTLKVKFGSGPLDRDVARVLAIHQAGFLPTNPELIRARSPRTHHANLLHYVGASALTPARRPPSAHRNTSASGRGTVFRSTRLE